MLVERAASRPHRDLCSHLIPWLTCTALVALGPIAVGDEPSGPDFFDERLAPLLANHCLECHNPVYRKGGLDLTTAAGALAGGDSGPAIVPGDAEASLVWQKLAGDEMP